MRITNTFFRIITASMLIVLLGTGSAYAASKKDVEDAKKKITSIQEEKKKIDSAVKELETLKGQTEKYVRELDGQLAVINEELDQLEVDIANKETEIEDTTAELVLAEETEREQYAAMKKRIRYMYEKNDSSYLDMLLSAGSLSELLNRTEYITQISIYDREMLDKYVEVKNAVADAKLALEGQKEELLALQESTKAKQASVKTLMDEKNAEVKRFQNSINEKNQQSAAMQKEIAAQEAEVKRIEAEIKRQEEEARKREEEARKKAAAQNKSTSTVKLGDIKFQWPCPASGRITSGFGSRNSPTEGASSYHQGIDIGAGTGSGIVAAASGTVSIATYSSSAGNYVMINHGGGVSTVYMHCSKLLVSPGQTVKAGQTIAKVGSTGYSTGPHLHFGIRSGGSYINPSKYVSP